MKKASRHLLMGQVLMTVATLVYGLCVYGSFMVSAFTSPLYGGSMGDEDGVPLVLGMDANILGFSISLMLLLMGWFLMRKNDLYQTGQGASFLSNHHQPKRKLE